MTTNTIEEQLCSAISVAPRVLIRGNGTKQSLWPSHKQVENCEVIDLRRHSGIVTYDPSEFLITAKSGTSIRELSDALAAHGQYLPFDPVFSNQGATLGGTIASGVSGPNRLLYGSLRDFVMEVQVIDGLGQMVRGGGKVVKNAAGFDLPKLMVGSYGRLGVITEATLKVFPQPSAYVTMQFDVRSLYSAIQWTQTIQTNPLPLAALDIDPADKRMFARFAGRPESLANVVRRVRDLLRIEATVEEHPTRESAIWNSRAEFEWLPADAALVRIATSGHKVPELDAALANIIAPQAVRYSAGGSVAWVAVPAGQSLDSLALCLKSLQLSGAVIRGATGAMDSGLPVLGDTSWLPVAERIRVAMDPETKFSGYC